MKLTIRQKFIYFLTAAAVALMLLGMPSNISSVSAGDCPAASGETC